MPLRGTLHVSVGQRTLADGAREPPAERVAERQRRGQHQSSHWRERRDDDRVRVADARIVDRGGCDRAVGRDLAPGGARGDAAMPSAALPLIASATVTVSSSLPSRIEMFGTLAQPRISWNWACPVGRSASNSR